MAIQKVLPNMIETDNSIMFVSDAEKTTWNGKSDKSTEQAKTLVAGTWTGASAPFSYVLTVTGVTTTSNQELLPSLTITQTELEALQGANIVDAGQSANTLTLYAYGTKPTVDMPIRVILRGDA